MRGFWKWRFKSRLVCATSDLLGLVIVNWCQGFLGACCSLGHINHAVLGTGCMFGILNLYEYIQ